MPRILLLVLIPICLTTIFAPIEGAGLKARLASIFHRGENASAQLAYCTKEFKMEDENTKEEIKIKGRAHSCPGIFEHDLFFSKITDDFKTEKDGFYFGNEEGEAGNREECKTKSLPVNQWAYNKSKSDEENAGHAHSKVFIFTLNQFLSPKSVKLVVPKEGKCHLLTHWDNVGNDVKFAVYNCPEGPCRRPTLFFFNKSFFEEKQVGLNNLIGEEDEQNVYGQIVGACKSGIRRIHRVDAHSPIEN